jgi:pyrroloquinoline quinone biosynthesis protein B
MIVRILGSAAGGGFPQWNCTCPGCRAARRSDGSARPRTQSSIAVAPGGGGGSAEWLLVNASPDLRLQLEALRVGGAAAEAQAPDAASPDAHDPPPIRRSPIAGVLLTDAEIDHTTGLLLLREWGAPIPLWCTATTRRALTEGFPVLPTLAGYAGVAWRELVPGASLRIELGDGVLEIEPFALGGDPPLYLQGDGRGLPAASGPTDWAIGVTFRDPATGGVLTYAPGLDGLDDARLERFAASDLLLVDGTCWRDDELGALGISQRTAREMGHLPLSGPDGTLERLRRLSRPRKVLVHINNTNPILVEQSRERRGVEAAGVIVGEDGMTFRC